MLLVDYSCSSDSEEDEVKKDAIEMLPKASINRILLPEAKSLLGKHKINDVNEVTDDPTKHDGRIRSFKHERGNWATYVYIPVNKTLIEDLQDICLSHLGIKHNFKVSIETHMSLTKTVVLQYHLIESFVGALRVITRNFERLTVSFNNLKVYTNAEHSRTFLALKIDDMYFEKMSNILQKVDLVMKDFKLATFYKDPSFHISILWCSGDCVGLVENSLPTILNSLTERLPLYLKIDKICCTSGFKQYYFNLK